MKKNKAQASIEYAILILIAAAALIGMKVYIQRSVQERYRESADVFGEGRQYAKNTTTTYDAGGAGTTPIPPGGTENCLLIKDEVSRLEEAISSLTESRDTLQKSLDRMNDPVIVPGLSSPISMPTYYSQEASRQHAEVRRILLGQTYKEGQATLANLKINLTEYQKDYDSKDCGSYPVGNCDTDLEPGSMYCTCDTIRNSITLTNAEITNWTNRLTQAKPHEDMANDLLKALDEWNKQAGKLEKKIKELDDKIKANNDDIDKLETQHPDCFK